MTYFGPFSAFVLKDGSTRFPGLPLDAGTGPLGRRRSPSPGPGL